MNKINHTFGIRSLLSCLIALVLCSLAPTDFLEELESSYEAYQEKYPSTKINIIFNQPIFSPGDTSFFSAWYVNEAFQPIKGDHILSLDLVNGNGITVQKIRFKVKNGRGSNQFVFKNNLPPAEYRFVAYTDWMKNFGESWFFQKRIQLVAQKTIQTQSIYDGKISFYPEGGNLVEGVNNKVVIIGPPSTELNIQDNNNSSVLKAFIDSTGVGSFLIVPQPNQTYFTTWPTSQKKWSLPKALSDGLALKLESRDTTEVSVTVPFNSKWSDKDLFAIVSSKGQIVFRKKLAVTSTGIAPIKILLREKTAAYHQLFLFDANKQVLAQRVFIPIHTNKVSAFIDVPSSAKQRQNLSLSIDVKDGAGFPLEAEMSVAISQKKLASSSQLINSFHLSDLPDAMNYAENHLIANPIKLNDFLITQQWTRINWSIILEHKIPSLPYPFQSLITLSGVAISKTTGLPPPDSTVVISYLQKNTVGYEAYTKNGKFRIPILFDFWGEDQIFCTLQNKSKNIDGDYNLAILKDSVIIKDRWTSSETSKSSPYGEFNFNKQIINKSYSYFGLTEKTEISNQELNSILEDEFMGADASIKIADYVLFPTMEDMLHEIVPFTNFQQRGSRKIIRISYRYDKSVKIYENDPLYIIDGIMSKNTTFFLSIKPENLLTVKIINNPNKLAQLGRLGENGIIFVESKKGNLFNSVKESNIFSIEGQSKPKQFYEPDYSRLHKLQRMPDLRSTLYWTPFTKAGKSGTANIAFFTSDDTGPMLLKIEGLTKDGVPFVTEKIINVEFGLPKQ